MNEKIYKTMSSTQKLAEWGVEMEKMMKYTGGTYDL